MDEMGRAERTIAIKACSVCSSALLDRDKFCRRCGERQPERMPSTPEQVRDTFLSGPRRYATSLLTTGARADVYRRVSGPLVNAVAAGALSVPSTEDQSPLVKRAILALISIPIWLIIVLLSPLDAYAAVKSLARQV
jgi:hypothetical protein